MLNSCCYVFYLCHLLMYQIIKNKTKNKDMRVTLLLRLQKEASMTSPWRKVQDGKRMTIQTTGLQANMNVKVEKTEGGKI